ncbi:MAG: UDP-N-acetylmuramate dehydrogenase [Candidatus Uhrbacteria bacterium]|nr:UDP-N-acetylmuramate dehydrogenase [Patescibacteria group bacterium]MBU1906653.1 UDP-N-acetylmuramate dehydrogenase [Patescibacteria group bacterium]
MEDITQQLRQIFGDRLKENEPLAKHSTFHVGGPARWLVEVQSADEVSKALQIANAAEVPHEVIGGGTNLLAADSGYEGLVFKIVMNQHRVEGDKVISEAGAFTAVVARDAVKAGLAGFTWGATLPGSIGGAVYGNAGCYGGEMKDIVESVKLLRAGVVIEVPVADLAMGYRTSALKFSNDVVLEVTLKLHRGDATELKKEQDELMTKRQQSQPLGVSCAGCIFNNHSFKDETDIDKLLHAVPKVPEQFLESKTISAGWLIEQVGMKGERIGDAEVSLDHGNFIVNIGHATADHIVQLISMIKMRVRDDLGIQLIDEVQYIGF